MMDFVESPSSCGNEAPLPLVTGKCENVTQKLPDAENPMGGEYPLPLSWTQHCFALVFRCPLYGGSRARG